MKIGYARASTKEQNLDAQIDALTAAGCEKIYQEKVSGAAKEKNRPELEKMLEHMRSGDTVVVYKLDRISRSTKHLIELAERFEEAGVEFVSIVDKIDTSTSMGRFFFRMMANIAELERDIIVERTLAGLEAARARGRSGGRPKTDPKKIEMAIKMHESKNHTIEEITKTVGISAPTLYRHMEKLKKEKEK